MEREQTRAIPKTLVQTFPIDRLPGPLAENRSRLAEINRGWTFEFFDDERIADYVNDCFGAKTLSLYSSIRPEYGAARADLFRYLRIYWEGGVYLDAKSTLTRPLDEIIMPCDEYILCQWANRPGEAKMGLGLHKDLAHVPGGEYQQWHVIARARHPYLERVIEQVLGNIRNYRPWRLGVGAPGVFRTTGPIAYTRAIAAIVDDHPHRLVRDETTIGLQYSIGGDYVHSRHFPTHYSSLTSPIVPPSLPNKPASLLYGVAARARNKWRQR